MRTSWQFKVSPALTAPRQTVQPLRFGVHEATPQAPKPARTLRQKINGISHHKHFFKALAIAFGCIGFLFPVTIPAIVLATYLIWYYHTDNPEYDQKKSFFHVVRDFMAF